MRERASSPLSAVASALVASAALLGDAAAAPTVVKTADIEYARVAGEALELDLYRLEGAAAEPLLVWVHGGGWEAGAKEPVPVLALVERGYALASLDFHPASRAPFPGQIHEIKAALRFLRHEAAARGYDARRIGLLGASSGAHLAALVGVTNDLPEFEGDVGAHLDTSSAVQAVVSYFGASNLTTILAQSTPFGLRVRTPALERLLGRLPEDDPEIARRASPVFHVGAAAPPLLLLHGDQDPQMPINQSHELEGAYERAGREAALIVVHGAAHGGTAFFDEERTARVAAFLDRHLGAAGAAGGGAQRSGSSAP